MTVRTSIRVAASGLAVAVGIGAASADSLYREQVSADSFGNLVVYSPSGYKRIVVGAGELASQLQDYGAGRPASNRDERGEGYGAAPSGYVTEAYRHCSREAVLLRGRSYMYGLPADVTPVPAGTCD